MLEGQQTPGATLANLLNVPFFTDMPPTDSPATGRIKYGHQAKAA